MLREIEQAMTTALLPLEQDGFYVLGAPTDHQTVGRVGKKGEVRVAYQSRDWQQPRGLKIEGRSHSTLCTMRFEVVVELQDMQLQSHGLAAESMEKVVDLLAGFVPDGECGSGLYPVKDGFVGRNKEAAVWIYSAVFALERSVELRRAS
jgi:hypothetical protein